MITVTDLLDTPINQLMTLSAEELCLLQKHIEQQRQTLKHCHDQWAAVVSQKYARQAQQCRRQHGKPTGVVRFDDGGVAIKTTITKRPRWNQKKLAEMAERIRTHGENPLEFMAVTYQIPESRYNAWPQHLRNMFANARTLELSRETFALTAKEEHQ